jgi:SAM-dependent methyltransferase
MRQRYADSRRSRPIDLKSQHAGTEAPLHVNYRYCIDWAKRVAAERPQARILDFGCGSGAVVEAGRALGLDFVGTDVFFAGADSRNEVARRGLLDRVVFEMREGRVPFEDGRFDLVTSNQVFEHVVDLDATLREVHRVLKEGGLFVTLFPSREVIREGHIGIPFAHRFQPGSRIRSAYTVLLRSLGLGYHDGPRSSREWASHWLRWIDSYTVYRPRRTILAAFGRFFDVDFVEEDYVRFRLSDSARLRPLSRLLTLPGASSISRVMVRRLATMVLVARKRVLPRATLPGWRGV